MLAPFPCDVDGINKKRQIVQRKRNKVVALKGLNKMYRGGVITSLMGTGAPGSSRASIVLQHNKSF